jgi:hypothetical protein
MRSSAKAGLYFRLVDRVYHSTLGLRVIKKKRRRSEEDNHLVLELPFPGSLIFSLLMPPAI